MEIVRDVKQYIIIRMDLGMSPGKLAAQASHSSMGVFFEKMSSEVVANNRNIQTEKDEFMLYSFFANEDEHRWIENGFTKIVKKVKNESQLLKLYQQAVDKGLNVFLVKDAGLTELEGENYTALAIGPNKVSDCESIVKKLQNL